MNPRAWLWLLPVLAMPVMADKVIMKDGKIYEGRIMGETNRSMLIRVTAPEAKSMFLSLREIQTIVRESHAPEKPSEEAGRFASIDLKILGAAYGKNVFDFDGAAGLDVASHFRVHPAFEVGMGIRLWPDLSGRVTLSDGITLRGYEHFSAWSGGFEGKVLPFYRIWDSRWEPFWVGGYHWDRLTPKGSGDHFNGHSWFVGPGVSWKWTHSLCWEARVLYQNTDFNEVKFQSGLGSVSGVGYGSWSFGTGLSWRFL